MKLSFELVQREGIRRYAGDLSALEQGIRYPLDEDHFTIDHGEDYGQFLDSLGEAWFLVVLREGRAVGLIAGALRDLVRPDGRVVKAIYVGDLKLAPELRGGRTSRALFARGLWLLLSHPAARGLRLVFGAGMSGARGDVRRSFRRRLHVGRLGRCFGTLELFFESPATLAALDEPGPRVLTPGLDMSGDPTPLVRRNTGMKDFRLASTGAPWRLAHLPRGPARWEEGIGRMLSDAARELEEDELACFAVDTQLTPVLRWLGQQGICPSARCRVLGLAHPLLGRTPLGSPAWIHLSPAEI